ncbi:MAG: bifunctional riboflavin kinase/FAD synthetase [Candidatus Kapabacteria bacterium]|nr:bifunctional riboflavin kinase/FAD synthetase [Candidatus Kapabacteria bacterium]
MNIVRFGKDAIPFDTKTAITVGTFDGVHCGHQGIIKRMREVAQQQEERIVVVTFDPHPQIVLAKPDREPLQLLTSIEERCDLLESVGVDTVVILPFSREFAAMPADEFVRSVIVESIGVQHFFIGHDHSFGKDRGGNEELLQQLGKEYGFEVEHILPLVCDGVVVNSTKVRAALKSGNVDEASVMLGRPYAVRGVVQHGDGRGRTLGIPTANIKPPDEHKLLPGNGIYVVSSVIDGQKLIGMASVGVRPMFTQDVVATLEVNYLDIDVDIYGRTLDVEFYSRLRDEINYASVDELLLQIEVDKQQTRMYQQLIIERSTS